MQSCAEWANELKREREASGEDWLGVTLQLRSFPDEMPKVSGEKNNWWRFPSTPEGLREPLWTFLTKGLEIPGILCVEPIMDAKSMWSRSEGVVVVLQLQEDFVKRCEPQQASMAKPRFSLSPRRRAWQVLARRFRGSKCCGQGQEQLPTPRMMTMLSR